MTVFAGCSDSQKGASSDSASSQAPPPDAAHYWDSFDFKDTTKSMNQEVMDGKFADFAVMLYRQNDSIAVAKAVAAYLNGAMVSQGVFDTAETSARNYFDDPDSPMRNGELWLIFLDVMKDMPGLEDYRREKYAYEHTRALKNRIGTIANDFKYTTRDSGAVTTLHETPAGSEGLLLILYDSECEKCEDVMKLLGETPALNTLIAEGTLAVLAVDTHGDAKVWDNKKGSIPSSWTVGLNTDNIEEREAYALPSMPVIFLLSPDYRVIAKDISLANLMQLLNA